MKRNSRRRSGFTLIEILLVVLIISALAAVAVVTLTGSQETANINLTKTKVGKVVQALELYKIQLNGYPTEEQGLKALVEKPAFDDENLGKNWRAPFLTLDDLKDAWGKDLVFKVIDEDTGSGTTRKKVHVYSVGPNGNDENGEGDDIKNSAWESESAAGK